MQPGTATLTFTHGNSTKTLRLAHLDGLHGPVTVSHNRRALKHGQVLTVSLTSSQEVELEDFVLETKLDHPQRVHINGFQSWSQSRELTAQQSAPQLFNLAKLLLAPYGDYHLCHQREKPGQFHSWSWAGFPGENYLLLASTTEDWGYTLFQADLNSGKLRIRRDCRGQRCRSFPLLQIYIGRGDGKEVWDEYASLLPGCRSQAPRSTGWTSWYNYYTKIDEEIIQDNLQALSETGHPFQFFQIDDGWQEGMGDWLGINSKFPSGLQTLARSIRAKGYQPGLWLAPFICDAKSRLWRENYDWVLKDENGRPVKAGWNPGWNGWFYALDFYAPGFQTWLRKVFDTIFNQWEFQMVKLDFLYAVGLRPNCGRSRGRIMTEAMDFLHQLCQDKLILGCGVPLAQAASRVDYCRIGSDVAPYWEDSFLRCIGYRERVSTRNSLFSTLHRHMLDQRLFRNDPDVFILRDGKRRINENKLTAHQRHTLFFLNNLLGGLIFLSDHVGEYSPAQKEQLAEMFPTLEPELTDFSMEGFVYRLEFKVNQREYVAAVNLGYRPARQQLPPGSWFHPDIFLVDGAVDLMPHQTLCLVKEQARTAPHILGSSGHLFPGAQVEKFTPSSQGWSLEFKPHSAPHSQVWIALPSEEKELTVNDQNYSAREKEGIHYIIV